VNVLLIVLLAVGSLALGAGVAWWRALARQPAPAAVARRSHVLYALAEGDIDNVAQELEQIAEAEPGPATVFLALAALDRRRGRVERAKAIHRTVLAGADLAPELRVAAFVGLGRDLLAQGHQEAAVGALSRAISLAPQSLATLETLARALEQAGAWERAAAAWERHEKLIPARRRRDSRIARGHAVAGQALAALEEGDGRKAERLIGRALELAPDSGHVWTARARVTASLGDAASFADGVTAAQAWQRAWELTPAAATPLIGEALEAAAEIRGPGGLAELHERMLASLRTAQDAALVVALAQRVGNNHPEAAAEALQRVRSRSPAAALSLVRLRLAQGHRQQALDAAMMELPPPIVVCRVCAREMPRFRFRCDDCGAWDSAVTLEAHAQQQVAGRALASTAGLAAASPTAREGRAEA
jgi:lipopolysaccharide biosynthesis regulator YciM